MNKKPCLKLGRAFLIANDKLEEFVHRTHKLILANNVFLA